MKLDANKEMGVFWLFHLVELHHPDDGGEKHHRNVRKFSTRRHSVTTQKTAIITLAAMKTPNLTLQIKLYACSNLNRIGSDLSQFIC